MTTTPNLEGKYQLKTLHAEIDLLDRRLAHLLKYDTFETEAARDAAARKISTKREPLVQTAKRWPPKVWNIKRVNCHVHSGRKARLPRWKSRLSLRLRWPMRRWLEWRTGTLGAA